MSVIAVNLYLDTDVYPYTDTSDLHQLISDLVHERVDASLIYTRDIIDTWMAYNMPECVEFEHPGTISEAITLATYEALIGEDYTDQITEGQIDYAAHLISQIDTLDPGAWYAVAGVPMSDAREALEPIAAGVVDPEDAHPVLIEWRDTINAAA